MKSSLKVELIAVIDAGKWAMCKLEDDGPVVLKLLLAYWVFLLEWKLIRISKQL